MATDRLAQNIRVPLPSFGAVQTEPILLLSLVPPPKYTWKFILPYRSSTRVQMATAIAILNHELNPLIARAYKYDEYRDAVLDDVFRAFKNSLQSRDVKNTVPVLCIDGYNYLYIILGGLVILMVVSPRFYRLADVMCYFAFLRKFEEILKSYFKTATLNQDMVVDNYLLLYELFDETMDFGFVQISDYNILNEYIKMRLNVLEHENSRKFLRSDQDKEHEYVMNLSISRMSTTPLSWRPKGIFYKKNEVFVDFVERVNLLVDSNHKIKKQVILGEIKVKCFLSGMPTLVLGLNEFLTSNTTDSTIDSFHKVSFDNLNFHQCVQLLLFANDNTISFIPPDGKFLLLNYKLQVNKAPLITVSNIDFKKRVVYRKVKLEMLYPATNQQRFSATPQSMANPSFPSTRLDDTASMFEEKVEKTVKLLVIVELQTRFTKRRTATDVSVEIPIDFQRYKVNFDYVPRFKTRIGTVVLDLEKQSVVWKISSIGGARTFKMTSELTLHDDDPLSSTLSENGNQSELLQPSDSSDSEAEKTYNYYYRNRKDDKKISEKARRIKKIYKTIQREQKTIEHANSTALISQEGPGLPSILLDKEKRYSDNLDSIMDLPNMEKKANRIDDSFYVNRNMVKVNFKIENLTHSGLKVTYLRIDEPLLKYTSFPWVKYVCGSEDEYVFKFDYNWKGPSETIVKHMKLKDNID